MVVGNEAPVFLNLTIPCTCIPLTSLFSFAVYFPGYMTCLSFLLALLCSKKKKNSWLNEFLVAEGVTKAARKIMRDNDDRG